MIRSLPLHTIALAALALLAWASPSLSALLVYDRSLVERGELWRIATSAFVHWSPRHLALDLAVVAAAGAVLERRIGSRVLGVVGIAALVSGAAVHLAPSRLDRYAGLSGVACALVALVAMGGARDARLDPWQRGVCLTTLAALVTKLGLELIVDEALFAADTPGIVVATGSHAAGLAVGFALALRQATFRRGPSAQ